MSAAERVPIAVAGAAERLALANATNADPPLTSREWRVLAAVIALTTSYCRLRDHVYVAQVAAFAFGFGFGRLPEQETPKKARDWRVVETGRALKRLGDRGIVIYKASQGRGRKSLIGLPKPTEKARAGTLLLDGEDGEKARARTPLLGDKRRVTRPLKGASSSTRPTEELPRRNLERASRKDLEEQGPRHDLVSSHDCDQCDNGWIEVEGGMIPCPVK